MRKVTVRACLMSFFQTRSGRIHYRNVAATLRRRHPDVNLKFAEAYVCKVLNDLVREGFLQTERLSGEFSRD
jgi:hypothetical protein